MWQPESLKNWGSHDCGSLLLLQCCCSFLRCAVQGTTQGETASSFDTATRRDKLARLRRAVTALDADAYAGRLGGAR